MSLNWNGVITEIVDLGSESYAARVRKLIFLGAALLLGIVIFWKVWR